MRRASTGALLFPLLILPGLAACLRPEAPDPRDEALPVPAPRVTRGELSQSLLLTGELDTAAAENLVVPRVPQWNIALRWLAKDGTPVKQGEAVAELDNTNFAADLADKKLAAARSASDLAHQVSQDAIIRADKTFALDSAKISLDKARLSAAIEKDALPLRDYQERQLERERAGAAFERAQDDLAAHTKSAALEAQIRRIALDKSQREIQASEQAIRQLVLRAPSDGLVVVSMHPWFGRKVQGGDNVWVGLSLVRLPELPTLHVKARLSDVDDGRLAVGMPAVCYLDAYPELEFPGVVSEVSPVAREPSRDSWRRSFEVRVGLDHVDLERMRPGMSVRVEVKSQRAQASLLAPRTSFDRNAMPARLQLEQGSVEVDLLECSLQSCAFRTRPGSAPRVEEGTLLRSALGRGS
ncbi:MAG: efflux RND transporter periplasmic adaptor subunit [Deltaproteobacteria bacterium]